MTQSKADAQKIAELNSTFSLLNDKGKDTALAILRTLNFAQAVMGMQANETAGNCRQQKATPSE